MGPDGLIHPILVHFPIALWLFGSLWLLVAAAAKKPAWANSAWVVLAAGAIMSLPAVVAGQNEIAALEPLDAVATRHRDLGNLLPWLMLGTLIIKAHTTWRKGAKPLPEWIWVLICMGIAGLVVWVAALGGEIVYTRFNRP